MQWGLWRADILGVGGFLGTQAQRKRLLLRDRELGGKRTPKSIIAHGQDAHHGHCKHHLQAHPADDWGEKAMPLHPCWVKQSERREVCLSYEW